MQRGLVYSFGMTASSTLFDVDGQFPSADGYGEIANIAYSVGGEAANSSIVLARLGAAVKLDGNFIGDDMGGQRTKAFLDGFGIDTSRLPVHANYVGVSEQVFAAGETRTIFGSYGHLLAREDWNEPQEEDIRSANIVCLDPFFGAASCRVARIASDAGLPVVTVDCRHDAGILTDASVIVVSHNFIEENYPDADPDELMQRYQQTLQGLVVFTFGAESIRYGRPGQAVQTMDMFSVDAVDTSCAGDSFRAGVVFGVMNGWDDTRTLRFAAAVAALVCTRFPGALNSPTLEEVQAFLDDS